MRMAAITGHNVRRLFLHGGGGSAVIGASDRTASFPTTTPYGIQDLLRTIFHLMGIVMKTHYTRWYPVRSSTVVQ